MVGPLAMEKLDAEEASLLQLQQLLPLNLDRGGGIVPKLIVPSEIDGRDDLAEQIVASVVLTDELMAVNYPVVAFVVIHQHQKESACPVVAVVDDDVEKVVEEEHQ